VVWFEDPRSFGEKFNLVREYQLRGMGAWQLVRHPTSSLVDEEIFKNRKSDIDKCFVLILRIIRMSVNTWTFFLLDHVLLL
jgi:hypothetical protein